jgi:hypothetical protein
MIGKFIGHFIIEVNNLNHYFSTLHTAKAGRWFSDTVLLKNVFTLFRENKHFSDSVMVMGVVIII